MDRAPTFQDRGLCGHRRSLLRRYAEGVIYCAKEYVEFARRDDVKLQVRKMPERKLHEY
jgi:hypothetical protein